MKIEIKRLTVNHRLSEETLNFACDIHVDGKRVGEATNHGTGGPTDVRVYRGVGTARRHDAELYARMEAWANENAPEDAVRWTEGDKAGQLVDGLGQYIDLLVHAEDDRKQNEKHARRIAKAEVAERAKNAARGMGTIRLMRL